MSKFLQRVLVVLMAAMPFTTYAQQLPDPGFEDWSGTQFDGNAQPKYWNFSNVSQMGVDKNFAHQTTGRSGKALKIQDQFVGVMGIGATSPGYVALGHPWAYVSSITSIEDATAGTYGGISWTYRPDSMVVWVKRYYDSSVDNAAGDHTKDENFNLLFYSWSGTSQGKSYKAKNLSCTDLSTVAPQYCTDEESDIRQATNGNECETRVQAKQIAEGWVYQKKAYGNWTRIVVPIYYLNDDAPTKCNVILSAGNYPNFRANSGQYAGSSLDVDDIHLVYSSKAQKIYVGGREWKTFDPDNTTGEQIYSLGIGATEIPEIFAVRGAGAITNVRGKKTNFPGRRLSDSECQIVYGQVDGAPTTVTVSAEDGSSTTTYRIKFVSQASSNARLSDIMVNGESISGFNAYLTSYNVALPYGTTEVPVVTATAQDATATIQITQPTSVNGTASIHVTAGDGTTTQTYNLQFSVAALTDVTLRNIFIDGNPLAGFQPTKSNYSVSLPLGTTAAPAVTWESAYPAGVQTIQLLNNTLEQGAQIQVTIPGSTLSKTYKLTYKIEASSYSYLAGIELDGTPLEGFQPEQTVYSVTLPMGATALPQITWTPGDPYQTVRMTEGGVDGTTRIEVTAASGATTTYRLQFRTEKSGNNALAAIMLDGQPLEGFEAEVLNYLVTLPAGTTAMPAITYTPGDAYQTVSLNLNQSLMTARLTVTAGDGSTRQYILNFEVEKSENAFLQMIYLDAAPLAGFEASKLDYTLTWPTQTIPHITVLADEGQTVTISAPSTYGTARIVVTPEEGTPNVYLIHFVSPDQVQLPAFPMDSFPASNNAKLLALYIDGANYALFDRNTYDYSYPLAQGITQVPAVVPVAATKAQTITVAHSRVDRTTTIHVLAADGQTSETYRIAFPVAKSSNTELLSVEIEGATINFDPAQHDYPNIILPYGTTLSPSITVERSESVQSLVITEAPLGQTSTVVVTAEDGTEATYTFSYQVALPNKQNELLAIVLDSIGVLDLSAGPDFVIDLPYGGKALDIISYTKSYPEQTVDIILGDVHTPTTITVHSLDPSEADKVYTISYNVYPYDPAMLLDIKVAGVSLPEFRPDVYNYVLSVNTAPEITYTAQEGVYVSQDVNEKFVLLESEDADGVYTHRYTVTFFYPGDFTFDLGFENWQDYTNSNTNTSGKCPVGWYAPINAETSGNAGTYYPENATQFVSSTKTQGSKAAELATTYLLTSAESMPGFLSLAKPTVSVGKWILWFYEIHSSLAFGDPIPFRNSPDHVDLDYNVQAYNKVTGWRFIYDANGGKQVNFAQNYSSISKNNWYTLSRDLTYDADFVPLTLNILISSAHSDALEDYFVSSNGAATSNRFTSEMLVDNLRFSYNSSLTNVKVNGAAFSPAGTTIAATVDADYYGVPELAFTHPVYDQMPVITWGEETAGVRTAQIRNYGEDLSYTDYTLTVTRPQSTNTACTYEVTGHDLKVVKASPYQTVAITQNDTAYVITVTAESGDEAVYYAAWEKSAATTARVHNQPAESLVTGTSTARLVNLETDPVLNYDREYALDSVLMVMTDLQYELHVFGETSDTTYIIPRNPSDNALLASMETNQQSVPDFYSETFDYAVSLTSLESFTATPQDPEADVRYTIVPINSEYSAIYVLVTAADGLTTHRYTVLANVRPLSSDAYLTAIAADDVLLTGFASDTYDYLLQLEAHSAIPTLSSVVCPGATVESSTVSNGSSATVTFTVTSEDETVVRQYVVDVQVLPSEIATLSDLFVAGVTVDGFASTQTRYDIELPYGTTSLPEVDYVLTDRNSTAQQSQDGLTVTVTVTAEDGIHTTDYTIVFTIAKSTNADLISIELDDTPLSMFYADEHHYDINLPYGAQLPVITATPVDPAATVVINGQTITVTAEDGQTTATYTLTFNYLPSTNAYLQAINLNDKLQAGYQADHFEYTDTVAYGAPMPVITWTVADEQQQVDTAWVGDQQLTITVTAGDGTTITEYVLTFLHMLSSNCRLADLRVRGTTIEGFSPDTIAYMISYPVATPKTALFVLEDVAATPEDPDATVQISMDGTTAQILVTAPDGTRGVYVVEQQILLSTEARLRMAWLDGIEVRDFNPDTLSYTIVLPQGANLPMITAETIDTLATWDQGMPVEVENGHRVELYSTAQDGTTLVYTLNFQFAKWSASTDIDTDDYVFLPIGNGQFKAVTIGIGVQLGIYDLNGHLHLLGDVPTVDPADVEVGIDANGNQRILSVKPSATGLVYDAPAGQYMFYVFFDSKTKKVAKGGKFQYCR